MTDGQNRRRAERHPVHFMAELSTNPSEEAYIAVTRDASAVGVLVLTRSGLEAGQEVSVKIVLPSDPSAPRVLRCKVVRKEALSAEEAGIWNEKVALELLDPDPRTIDELVSYARDHE